MNRYEVTLYEIRTHLVTYEVLATKQEAGGYFPHFKRGGAVPKINYGDNPDEVIQSAMKIAKG